MSFPFRLAPPFDFQDATEADGVVGVAAFAVPRQTVKFHEHFRRFGRVTVAEMDHVVMTALQPATPVRSTVAIFRPLRSRRNLREWVAVQNEM